MSGFTTARKGDPAVKAGPRRDLARLVLKGAGWVFLVAGVAGFILPVMPGTVFLVLSLWCFSRSSPRMRHWLLNNAAFGQHLANWESHRVIPPRAKRVAGLFMAASVGLLAVMNGLSPLVIGVGVLLSVIFLWMMRCPGSVEAATLRAEGQRRWERT